MAKIKALITLVIDKGKEVLPGFECDVNENEAKRLVSLGFAARVKSEPKSSNDNSKGEANEPKTNGESGDKPIQPTGDQG